MTLIARPRHQAQPEKETAQPLDQQSLATSISPRQLVIESTREKVLAAITSRTPGTISLDLEPAQGVSFVTTLGSSAFLPGGNYSTSPLTELLLRGVLPVHYFSPVESWNKLGMHAPQTLITIEGKIPSELISEKIVLGPGPFINRLTTAEGFLIEHISRISINPFSGNPRLEEHMDTLSRLTALLPRTRDGFHIN